MSKYEGVSHLIEILLTKIVGYPVNNSSPLLDFLREQSKQKAEQEKKIREKEELRTKQKEEMLKRRQEEEEEEQNEIASLLKPNHSKPIFPALWLENKAFRQVIR